MIENLKTLSAPFPEADLTDKSVLITGGSGSFGQAFVRHVLESSKPDRLIIFSRDEQKQFDMQHALPVKTYPCLRYFIGDVRDRDRLHMAMRGVDYVIHAAALKHVPAAEYNPFECIQTNVHGAENVVRAALDGGVKKVLALSTDKAANPVNLYGASKLAADKIFVAANHLSGKGGTEFSVVRYGNVLGSRGSVAPFFRRLIEQGTKSLPVTDPTMTRFTITLTEGVRFVLSSLAMMKGGEIFVPKIPSLRLSELVEALAPGAKVDCVGVRPGEKLHEVLITEDEARTTFDLGDRYVVEPAIHLYNYKSLGEAGHPSVAAGFCYRSDTNAEWLDADALRAVLKEQGLLPSVAADRAAE
ncbi:MAG: UDP-N-acetylglucosamine 4,6-dehydratase (inverting) [Pseudolabrys sp.]